MVENNVRSMHILLYVMRPWSNRNKMRHTSPDRKFIFDRHSVGKVPESLGTLRLRLWKVEEVEDTPQKAVKANNIWCGLLVVKISIV